MRLQERITQDLANAITDRDNQRRDFLKVVVGELSRKESKEVTDSETISLLKKMLENATALNNSKEVAFCMEYLPTMMSEADITTLVANIIESNNFSSKKDLGKVMAIISKHPQTDVIDKKIASKHILTFLN